MRLAFLIAFALALFPFAARAQYEQDFGAILAHYSALPTERLLPAMAKTYGIERVRNRALVNVAIERKSTDNTTLPARATLTGNAVSISGQSIALTFREIAEDGTVSYIGEFPISAPDTYRFTIEITPEGATTPYTLKFSQDFIGD